MKCSRNELTALMYKAAVGSGCAIAIADEIARAACSLQRFGYQGVELFLAALDARKAETDKTLQRGASIDSWFATVTLAMNGPSVFDALCLDTNPDQFTLQLRSVDVPFLLVGLAVERSAEQHCRFNIVFSEGATALVSHTAISVSGEIPMQPCCAELIVFDNEAVVTSTRAPIASSLALDVDDHLWLRCKKLASLTHVPSTEASRLAGAGAGLTDND